MLPEKAPHRIPTAFRTAPIGIRGTEIWNNIVQRWRPLHEERERRDGQFFGDPIEDALSRLWLTAKLALQISGLQLKATRKLV
jgi:hypothetical protein